MFGYKAELGSWGEWENASAFWKDILGVMRKHQVVRMESNPDRVEPFFVGYLEDMCGIVVKNTSISILTYEEKQKIQDEF